MKKTHTYSSELLKKDILKNARSLGIAEKWAENIADETIKHVDDWIKKRGIVTDADIHRVIYKKLKVLNSDIAYIYKNHGKIL